jgi:H+/Cl- antiporter ClcA
MPKSLSSEPDSPGRKSPGRRALVGGFLLLAVGFALRFCQNAYHWLAGHGTAETNYKALTAWCLVYLLVCGGAAWIVHRLPSGDDAVK